MRRFRSLGLAAAAAGMVAASTTVPAGGVAAAPAASGSAAPAFTAPAPLRVIAGPSAPAIAAWGLAYNPVTDELLVGDYLVGQVRRYGRDGSYRGDLANPKGNVGGVASALSVDPRTGDVYLAVTGEGRTSKSVRVYDSSGAFQYDFDVTKSTTWLAMAPDGDLWVPEAFLGAKLKKWHVDPVTHKASEVVVVDDPGTGPGQIGWLTGVAVDAAGNVYTADVKNHTVHSYDATGKWRADIGTKKLLRGDIRGLAVDDEAGRLYVANSDAGTIEVFDLDGAHLSTFAGLGSGPGQFADGARQLAVGPAGHVFAADYGSRRVQEFAADGSFVAAFPQPVQPADPSGLTAARGLAVDPRTGDVLVANTWDQRVQRFSADGRLLDQHGRRGSDPADGMNYPKALAVDPKTGNVWVGNYEGAPDLVVYDKGFTKVVRTIDTPRFVNDIEIVGNEVYVAVRKPAAVNVYDRRTGALLRTCCTAATAIRGIGVDPATGAVWATHDTKPLVYVYAADGTVLTTLPIDKHGWGVEVAGDLVYVADTSANKIVVFSRTTYERLGTIGTSGAGFGQLGGPSGLDTDASGTLYVVEQRSGRVQAFGTDALVEDGAVPGVTVDATFPTSPQLVPGGSAVDAGGVAGVDVQVKDLTTGLSYNVRTNQWASLAAWSPAVVEGPADDVRWHFTVVRTLPGHRYTIRVRARDRAGTSSPVVSRTVTVD